MQEEHYIASLECQVSALALGTLTSPNLSVLIHEMGVEIV